MRDKVDNFVKNDYAKVVAAIGIVTDEPGLADEGVQTALVKVASNSKQYNAMAARVAIVATGEVRLISRRRRNEELSGIASSAPEDLPPPLEQSAPIVEAVRQLSQRQREIALIHFYLGTSIPDIVDVSYLNESTVRAHIDQARRSIAEYLVNVTEVKASPTSVPDHEDRTLVEQEHLEPPEIEDLQVADDPGSSDGTSEVPE